jgi:hypothetical protein
MSWNPPRKYKGKRSIWPQAATVNLPVPDVSAARSLNGIAEREANRQKLYEMESWCEEFCSHEWHSSSRYSWSFAKTSEAILFKMIFGGK